MPVPIADRDPVEAVSRLARGWAYSASDQPTQAPAAPVADQARTPPVEVPAPAPRSTPTPTPPADRVVTLALAGDARVELLGGDCGAPLGHQLSELARHASSSDHHYCYALTVTGGAVQRVQELRTGNAC